MFKGIHHVAVVVRDIEKALGFFRDVLGLPLGQRATVADQGVQAALLPAGRDEIELLEPTNPAGGVARFLEKKGEGIHHLCVETSDVAAALERVKAANLPVIDQAPRKGLAGTIAFLHPGACHGVLLELAQPTESEHPRPAPAKGIGAVGIETFYLGQQNRGARRLTAARADFGICASMRPKASGPAYDLARTHAALGNRKQALSELRRALDLGFRDLGRLATDPEWVPLRAEPEFQALASGKPASE